MMDLMIPEVEYGRHLWDLKEVPSVSAGLGELLSLLITWSRILPHEAA